ncbi:MAG TPA: hypothetical protein VF909_09915, partial [Roseiflexaceae bacterium]
REFSRGGWPVDLRGMTEAEARELIAERVRVLTIEKLVGDLTQLEPLLAATGGNPKAIELTMGLLKYERRPLQQVVDDLYAARGELFDDLFARAWALLDEAARRVLLVATFFPTSASSAALSATADVQGYAFDRAVERLSDLALLDVQREDLAAAPRYTQHPLVRAFATVRLAEQPELERASRKRWVDWYISLTAQVGYCWDDLNRLGLLDPERDTIPAVVKWAHTQRQYDAVLKLVGKAHYYHFVRGLWDNMATLHLTAADVAAELGNPAEELRMRVLHFQLLSRWGDTQEAEECLQRIKTLSAGAKPRPSVLFLYHDALGLYWRAKESIDNAQKMWQRALKLARGDEHREVTARSSIATCIYERGRSMGNFEEVLKAKRRFLKLAKIASSKHYQRLGISIQAKIAAIELDEERPDDASRRLITILEEAEQYQDRRAIAKIQRLLARLHSLRGDLPAAHASLAEAIDLFERLGMRRELAEARAELARLEAMSDTA